MSRIGKQPVALPQGVKVQLAGQHLRVEGPKGKLERHLRPEVNIEEVDGELRITRKDDAKQSRAFHGMERSLVNNMVVGVSEGYKKRLDLIGVGFRADLKGKVLNLALGYSHEIDFPVPEGVKAKVIKEGREISVELESADKQLVGQVAAQIRALRPPEPYKGKGVRYSDEVVRRKAGKAGKA